MAHQETKDLETTVLGESTERFDGPEKFHIRRIIDVLDARQGQRTRAGLASARARGRKGGRRPKMTPAKLRLAMAAMGKPETNVGDLCRELGVTRSTLYRHVSPTGEARDDAKRVPKLA